MWRRELRTIPWAVPAWRTLSASAPFARKPALPRSPSRRELPRLTSAGAGPEVQGGRRGSPLVQGGWPRQPDGDDDFAGDRTGPAAEPSVLHLVVGAGDDNGASAARSLASPVRRAPRPSQGLAGRCGRSTGWHGLGFGARWEAVCGRCAAARVRGLSCREWTLGRGGCSDGPGTGLVSRSAPRARQCVRNGGEDVVQRAHRRIQGAPPLLLALPRPGLRRLSEPGALRGFLLVGWGRPSGWLAVGSVHAAAPMGWRRVRWLREL
jgi:hypothetical protein